MELSRHWDKTAPSEIPVKNTEQFTRPLGDDLRAKTTKDDGTKYTDDDGEADAIFLYLWRDDETFSETRNSGRQTVVARNYFFQTSFSHA